MATNARVYEQLANLASDLKLRLSALATPIILSDVLFDSDSAPYLKVGTGVAGAKGGILKIVPYPWAAVTNIIGAAQPVYSQAVCQLVTETNTVAGTDINDPASLLPILGMALGLGMKFEWYKTANTVAPTTGAITGTNLKSSFDNLYYPLVNSQ